MGRPLRFPVCIAGVFPHTNHRGANTPDWLLFNVFDSMTSWASFVDGIFGSDAGQQLVRHFGAVVDCDQAIWSSQRTIAPPTGG